MGEMHPDLVRAPGLQLRLKQTRFGPAGKQAEHRMRCLALRNVTDGLLDVEIVRMPLEEITPTFVKENFVQMVMYSYWEWLEVHSTNGNLKETQCPSVTLIGPAIIKSKEAAKQLKGIDVFTVIEDYTGLFIKLSLRPVDLFCLSFNRFKEWAPKIYK